MGLKTGAHVGAFSAFDPVVKRVSQPGFEGLEYSPSIADCLARAHCCIVFDRVGAVAKRPPRK